MSRTIKHLLIGGLIIMTMGATRTTAGESAKLEIINPPQLGDPTPNGYSTAVIVPAGGQLAYISGQGGFDATAIDDGRRHAGVRDPDRRSGHRRLPCAGSAGCTSTSPATR